VPELDEFIVLTIKDMGTQMERNAEGFSLGANHTITIPANDNTVGFASAMSTLVEGDGTETEVMVSVNRPAPVDITVDVSPASSSTAELGADYSISATSLMIPARESGGTITLTGMEDSRNEGNETIDLTLSVSGDLPDGWGLGTTTHEVTLQDNDLVVGFDSPEQTVEEPASTMAVRVPVTVNREPASKITLNVAHAGEGDASTTGSGGDYVVVITSIEFLPGASASRTKYITVNLNPDSDAELEGRVVLTLSNQDGSLSAGGNAFSLGQKTHTIIIPPNDNMVSVASTSDTTLAEGDSTEATVTVNVNKVAPSNITLNVTGSTTSGDAVAGTDYGLPSTLTIDAGDTSGEITLTGMNDELREGSEPFTLTFAGNLPKGWDFAEDPLTHSMTLLDDDLRTGFVLTESDAPAPASFGTFPNYQVEISLPSSPAAEVSLTIDTTGGTAIEGGTADWRADSSKTITFAAGVTEADLTQTFNFAVLGPSAAGKTIMLTLNDPGETLKAGGNDFTLDSATHTVNITSP
ncbi:MAG: hypothetical protein OXF24_05760, partial [Hyphomicrobiales bacterium]|nr:hypothetical protein [Hyphomicrobiales bacterium]